MSARTRPRDKGRQRIRTLPENEPGPLGEFELIARDLAPLAGDGARGLVDDVALFAGHAVTTDTICAGVHFFADDALDGVAGKVVRVNVSDLVAKGCRPVAMTLASAWHAHASPADHGVFARGLAAALARDGIALLGGDTTRLPPDQGPVFTVTMFGAPLGARVPSRAGARPGDVVFVTGTIGDAWLGLQARLGAWDAEHHSAAMASAYLRPEPPVGAAAGIAEHATASLDVSDGLIADGGHIAKASGLTMRLFADRIPLSAAGRAALLSGIGIERLCSGGDDYQALVTVAPSEATAFETTLRSAGITATQIGVCEPGSPRVSLVDPVRGDITPTVMGWTHRRR